jgi:hypothetical protein
MDMLTRARRLTLTSFMLGIALMAGALAQVACGRGSASARSAQSSAAAHGRLAAQQAHSASSYQTGIGDEQTEMFTDAHWRQLHTRIVRYIAPYDVAYDGTSLARATAWIHAAESQHQQILMAFYHSERSPTHMPSVTLYERDVKRFMKLFPEIRQYQPWNEANRGNVAHMFASPSAVASAKYYQALKRACHVCTVVGLDILDQQNVIPSLDYIAEFKREINRLQTVMPSVWGLHDYSDTNRFQSIRTRAIVAAVPGQVWLTETGGIVQFGSGFSNVRGSGLKRAANALTYMFGLAASNPRITRLYIFQWTGSNASARFDAGLTDVHYRPRAGYVVVCHHLQGAHCNVQVSSH